MFAKKIFKDSGKVKKQKLCIKMQSISEFLDITKVVDFGWKTQGVCYVIYIFLYIL